MVSSKILKNSIIILIVLFIIRLAMPYGILWYAENRINKIPEYRVKISDIDVHLYRGSYTIKNIQLYKINKKIPVPFFSAKTIDLSVEWGALLHGSLVGQIIFNHPTINFVIDPKGDNQQLSINEEWQNAVKALFPLSFNKIVVNDGALHFRSFTSQPPFNLYLKDVNATINNLRKTTDGSQKLPSLLDFYAKSIGNAEVNLTMRFDPFATKPTFYMAARLKNMNVQEANNFLRHYTKIAVKQGQFSLYAEAAAANGKIKGYAKPLIKNLQVTDPQKNTNPIEALYKGALQIVTKILENPKQKTVATRINISGNIEDPDTSIWSIVGYLLSHAFVQALLPQIDHTVKMQDVELANKENLT